MDGKRVLLFASKLGYQTRAFGAAAERLGIELAFVTDRCHQLIDPWNDKAISAHFETPEEAAFEVLQSERGLRVDAILALGDRPGVTAALVARGLGIRYNHPISVEACRSKLRMREVFRDAHLPVPWFRSVALDPPPEPALLGITYPCVLKPLSLSASQGVVRANSREEFVAGAARLKRLLQSPEIRALREPNLDQMLVEEYVPGREVAVEGLLSEGVLRILAIFDKPDPLEGPYFEETIYVTPSRLPAAEQSAIHRSMAGATRALGLTHGPVHAEFRLNEMGVLCLEVAPRPIGGLCARSLHFNFTADQRVIGLEELLLRHALDLPGNEAVREAGASGVMMIPVPRSGIFKSVDGQAEARRVSAVTDIEITARIHDYLAAWPEGSSYLGFIFARATAPAAVEAALRSAHRTMHFQIVPRIPVGHPVTQEFPGGDRS
jgi:biotin carboxylase